MYYAIFRNGNPAYPVLFKELESAQNTYHQLSRKDIYITELNRDQIYEFGFTLGKDSIATNEGDIYPVWYYCEVNGLDYYEVHRVINSNHTPREAVGLDMIMQKRPVKHYLIDNEDGTYTTIKDYCKAHNINEHTARTRIYRGYTVREAVGLD